jgi:DNA-binding NtrC family response regulator
VRYILEHKSQHPEINAQTQFNPAYGEHNAELTAIARLGKNALKNQQAMTLLWSTFKNQNQIATFLGVNRSSVNRRCQAYNLRMS